MNGSRVVGVIKDPRQETLETDLRSAGLNDFEVMSPGRMGSDLAAFEAFSQYEEPARAGRPIIAVKVESRLQADLARDVLQRNQVEDVRLFE